ncbi:hypothetical protein AN286_01450 [Aliarcobacter cryaerophilus ATCC 43158]|uniref:Membrane protein n=1 Tax=Aliarcobacter cryaerophilus ATCC 43158 TaxID=1032070 RepID=A0AAD0TTV5_9BACT|nr:hypothetical protein [Aliarcobacter cryaerophilus]AYJ80807.1 putative membrane protein [Aliarcobacter cryaerophilus ATCC 43158]PRM98304.1 hypothetical protein CJ667_02385 [Aliarcobacter cryaerophilus]QCZ23135.1 hypothetical protein AN286_01450 [Aliarcobacter cryaerophilus ATCC 43158]
MIELFNNFSTLIIFLHVISAIVWLGGMIVIRFAIHYSMQNIEEPKIKLGRTLENLKRFFYMVIPSIIALLITAIILILALNFKDTSLYKFVIAKEIIWLIMTAIFMIIYIKRNKAQKAFDIGDFTTAKNKLNLLAKYLIPINIFLGIIAVILGITLRGF